jgi:predicted amidophosphoribosyltransferase
MKTTRCPKCGSLIEEGWHVCWSCQYELPEINAPKEVVTREQKEDEPKSELVMVDKQKIIQAGKQLKMVVKLVLFSMLAAIITIVLYLANDDERTFFLGGLFVVVLYVAQLVNLFQAGNDLVKSVDSSEF